MNVMKKIGIVCLGISISILIVLCWHDALFDSILIKPSLCPTTVRLEADGTCGYAKIVSPWFILSGMISLFGLLSMFGARFYRFLTMPVKLRRAQKKAKRQEKSAKK